MTTLITAAKETSDHANLAAFSRQPTRHDNFSSRQTGLNRLYENFSARLVEISAA